MELHSLLPTIEKCVRLNIPFAAFALPGSSHFNFAASLPHPDTGENNFNDICDFDGGVVNISMFDRQEPYMLSIHQALTPEAIDVMAASGVCLPAPEIRPITRSTDRTVYNAQLHVMKKRLRRDTEKVVLSRIIAGSTAASISDILTDYFGKFPAEMRAVFFTQETGLWITATPELVVEYNTDGSFTTMALAGTRPKCEPDTPWDEKNTIEHNIVTQYLCEIFRMLGAENLRVEAVRSAAYGDIEHRCQIIRGTLPNCHDLPRGYEMSLLLAPTPAISGYPKHKALEIIFDTESHPRYCYGGCFTPICFTPDSLSSYAIIRCAHLLYNKADGTYFYNVYAGGGITSRSNPDDEWEETEAKAAPLLASLNSPVSSEK